MAHEIQIGLAWPFECAAPRGPVSRAGRQLAVGACFVRAGGEGGAVSGGRLWWL
jgi:hypothetical protein